VRPDGADFAARHQCERINAFSSAFFDAARRNFRPAKQAVYIKGKPRGLCRSPVPRVRGDVFSAKPRGISRYLFFKYLNAAPRGRVFAGRHGAD